MRKGVQAAALLALVGCTSAPVPAVRTARAAVLVPIAAGETQVGDDAATPDESPAFHARVPAFVMDRTPVTAAQFAEFVRATGYITDAERDGGGQVLDRASGGWTVRKAATWRHPSGSGAPRAADHPVVQVSWRDAEAFCRAYGLRLPTEVEWERAARLGQTADGHVFRAGDPVDLGGRWRANVWQGLFPLDDEGKDGWRTTSPVGAFGAAPSGLTDMAGNVWEWTASWYAPYAAKAATGTERVQRGGSFLCDPGFCQGFRATARGHATPRTALMHVGFRCAADGAAPPPLAGRLFARAPSPTRRPA